MFESNLDFKYIYNTGLIIHTEYSTFKLIICYDLLFTLL